MFLFIKNATINSAFAKNSEKRYSLELLSPGGLFTTINHLYSLFVLFCLGIFANENCIHLDVQCDDLL